MLINALIRQHYSKYMYTVTVCLNSNVALHLKADHPRICTFGYVCMTFCSCDLDVDPMISICGFYLDILRYLDIQILGIRWRDHIRNVNVPDQTGLCPVVQYTVRCRNSIFGHVATMPHNTPAHQALRCHMDLSLTRQPDK